MKRFLKILFLFLLLSFLTPQVKAADINVDCPDSSAACSKSSTDPLFSISADGYWYPGRTLTKTINLKNASSQTREMAIRGTKTSGVGILENVMNISIVGGTTVIWSGSVDEFYGQDKIGMGIFAPDANLDYDFTVSMSSGANDDYQGEETVFDLTLGFWGELSSTPTPTPTSAPGGGGEVLGAGVSASTCNDSKPVSAPILLSAVPGTNSVTLAWSVVGNPVSYYLVAYGTSSGSYQYGNPSVGGANTTSYTITNLSGNTTYYFAVRAGNGCSPGPFSNELSSTPGGIVVSGIAEGFAEGVLGEATQSAEMEEQTGVNGEQTGEIQGKEDKICVNAWWWWVVMVVYGIYNTLFLTIGKKIKRIIKFVFCGIASIIAIILLMNALCNWWLAVLITILIGVIEFFLFEKHQVKQS
ncbi:hypothetical protein COY15_03975 [Candidatus Roizmanbacteria bacterium CG_4_10_14_0_2_um_filter_39_12]|nr:MAG: hypothetical protein COY15_03975 [Candidatus Roizmanbacteria bacterium CG_4_10_14_0_2_um_filter_39_12]